MIKNIIIVLLSIAVVWLSSTVVRLENYRYASFMGMCDDLIEEPRGMRSRIDQYNCLNETETRTSPVWHIFYALTYE